MNVSVETAERCFLFSAWFRKRCSLCFSTFTGSDCEHTMFCIQAKLNITREVQIFQYTTAERYTILIDVNHWGRVCIDADDFKVDLRKVIIH